MNKLIDTVKTKLTKEKGLRLVVLIGIIGMGLILLSGVLPKSSSTKPKATTNAAITDVYKQEMQEKLSDILATIEGVGRVNVLLTVSASEEVIFAQEIKEDESLEASKRTTKRDNSYVLVDGSDSGGSKREALVRKILTPQISGVIVVCEGGANVAVKESIYKTVSVALEIPTNKIYVAKARAQGIR